MPLPPKSTCICGGKGIYLCGGCHSQRYCSRECQKSDWKRHKKLCSKHIDLPREDAFRSFVKGTKGYCGKSQPMEEMTTADFQRLASLQYGQLELLKRIYDRPTENPSLDALEEFYTSHILEHWSHLIQDLSVALNESNDDYKVSHIMTIPNHPIFNEAVPKPSYWTFAIIVTKTYPGYVCIWFSDDDSGVFNRLGHKYGNGTPGYVFTKSSSTRISGSVGFPNAV